MISITGSRRRKGFTLLEIVLVLAIGSMILGAAVGASWWASLSLRAAEDRLDQRERMLMAVVKLRSLLADSWQHQVVEAGAGLTFVSPRSQGTVRHDPALGKVFLVGLEEGAVPLELLREDIRGFRVEDVSPGLIRVTIDSEEADQPGRPGRRPLRVVEEIFCPVQGSPPAGLPWNDMMEAM